MFGSDHPECFGQVPFPNGALGEVLFDPLDVEFEAGLFFTEQLVEFLAHLPHLFIGFGDDGG